MSLKEKWDAESTSLGKLFHTYFDKLILVAGTVPELLVQYTSILPREVVPSWTWQFSIGAAIFAHTFGKLTVKKDAIPKSE